MAKAKAKTLSEALNALHNRCDDERFKVQRAGSLLKILAEHCQENRHSDTEGAWFEAEYLADRLIEHAEAVANISEDIERLAMRTDRDSPAPTSPDRLRLNLVRNDGGDAA